MAKGDIELPNESGISDVKGGARVKPYSTSTGKDVAQSDLDLRMTRAALLKQQTKPRAATTDTDEDRPTTRAGQLVRNLKTGRDLFRGGR